MFDAFGKLDEVSRRQFVQSLAKGTLGVSALPIFGSAATAFQSRRAQSPRVANQVIYLFMNGAMSHLDTFDPKPGTEEQGATTAIQTTVPGVQLSEHFPRMATLMKGFSLIRSMTQQTAAHEQGSYRMRTSYDMIASTRHPGLGAWLQLKKGRISKELPASVVIGNTNRHPGAGYLGAKYSPIPIQSAKAGLQNTKPPGYLSETQFKRRMDLANNFDRTFKKKYLTSEVKGYSQLYAEAISLLKSKDLEAFDINKEPEKIREAYGSSTIGQGCLLARRLVENGVRFVEVAFGGWDDHREIFTNLPDRAKSLDQALSSLLRDLHSKGLYESTLVVLTSEFGRTPKINVNGGRDHHPGAFTTLLAGGPVNGGIVFGKSDEAAHSVEEDPVSVEDLNATIAKAVGIDWEDEIYSPSGRPFDIANGGIPIGDLV